MKAYVVDILLLFFLRCPVGDHQHFVHYFCRLTFVSAHLEATTNVPLLQSAPETKRIAQDHNP